MERPAVPIRTVQHVPHRPQDFGFLSWIVAGVHWIESVIHRARS